MTHQFQTQQRQWLSDRLAAEQRVRESHVKLDVLRSLLNPRVLALGLVYLGIVTPNYRISFFLPVGSHFGVRILDASLKPLMSR